MRFNFFHRHSRETVIFCVAVILRLAFLGFLFFRFGGDFYTVGNSDAFGYIDIGESLARGRGFQMYGITSAMRTPGYPLFLSLFSFLSIPLFFVPVVQHVLAGASAVLLYRLGKIFFNERAGFIAGLLFAIEPYGLLLSNTVMTEVIFTFFILLSLYFFARWEKDREDRVSSVGAGISLGAATLIRPLSVYLPALLIVFLFWRTRREWRGHVRSAFLFFAAFILMLAPWSIRQYRAFGSFELTNLDTYLMYFRVAPVAEAAERGISYDTAVQALVDAIHKKIPNFNQAALEHTFAYTEILAQESRRIIGQRPGAVAQYFLASLPAGLFASGYNELLELFGLVRRTTDTSFIAFLYAGQFREAAAAALLFDLVQIAVFFGALLWGGAYGVIVFGLIRLRQKRSHDLVPFIFFLSIAAFFVFFALGPSVFVRYRVLSYPFLFLLVGVSADLVLKKRV